MLHTEMALSELAAGALASCRSMNLERQNLVAAAGGIDSVLVLLTSNNPRVTFACL